MRRSTPLREETRSSWGRGEGEGADGEAEGGEGYVCGVGVGGRASEGDDIGW